MIAALLLALSSPAQADAFTIDGSHTSVIFSVQHLGAAWVYGRFNDVSGSFEWDADPNKVKVDLTIQATSVDTENEKRDKHLRSADFFSADEFPTITFKTKSCAGQAPKLTCKGDLTMHGVTKEISIDVEHTGEGTDPWGGYRLGVHSAFSVKRSDFGITYMPDGLSDDVKLLVALEGTKQ